LHSVGLPVRDLGAGRNQAFTPDLALVLPIALAGANTALNGNLIAARALPDDEHVVLARDQFPDHRHSGQFPGHEQPAGGLRVGEQQQVLFAGGAGVGVR
jgi:hypothetical protein